MKYLMTVGLLCIFVWSGVSGQTTFKGETRTGSFVLPEVTMSFGTYHALIIAVQNYDDKGWSNPGPTIEYARKFKQVLTERYTFNSSNVTFLQDPTREEILGELETLRQTLTENDNLLLAYVGLGSWLEQVDQGYWIPRDANYEKSSTWIPNSAIAEYINKLNTRHFLLIADARISGNDPLNVSAVTPSDSSITRMNELRSRRAISGNTMKDILVNRDFLQTLLQVLEKNPKKLLSESQVSVDLGIVKGISGQAPVYGVIRGTSDEGGEFIFVRR